MIVSGSWSIAPKSWRPADLVLPLSFFGVLDALNGAQVYIVGRRKEALESTKDEATEGLKAADSKGSITVYV